MFQLIQLSRLYSELNILCTFHKFLAFCQTVIRAFLSLSAKSIKKKFGFYDVQNKKSLAQFADFKKNILVQMDQYYIPPTLF